MKVHEPRHRNPFDNPLVRLGTHVIALSVACGSVYFAVAEGSGRRSRSVSSSR